MNASSNSSRSKKSAQRSSTRSSRSHAAQAATSKPQDATQESTVAATPAPAVKAVAANPKAEPAKAATTPAPAVKPAAEPRADAAPTAEAVPQAVNDPKPTTKTAKRTAKAAGTARKASASTSAKRTTRRASSTQSAAAKAKKPAAASASASAATSSSAAAAELPIAPTPAPAAMIGRIPAMDITPQIMGGSLPVKGTVKEAFPVQATVWREGHDLFACEAVLVDPDGKEVQSSPMTLIHEGVGRYEGWLTPQTEGDYRYFVRSWSDPVATWHHNAEAKLPAGVDVELVFLEASQLLHRAAENLDPNSEDAEILNDAASVVELKRVSNRVRYEAATSAEVTAVLERHPIRELVTETSSFPIRVQRHRALSGAWYEIFPRSIGATLGADGKPVPGNLRTAADDLERIANMGFDVVYMPPINPIGTTARKGKNNSLVAGPDDPGSPYAIGSEAGGHDAIAPELGTMADFEAFVARAKDLGLEVAIDFALQCSPDHPWLKEHPEWFAHRADGTIAYAENPPKKYQDIYPLYFDNDPEGLYREIVRILEFWVSKGVRIFRVDNPHTKPVNFWQRLLTYFHEHHPEVLFLAEALSTPQMLLGLGAVGFDLSYCYFPWRNTKEELEDYLWEVSRVTDDRMRPVFWPTTPDVLTPYMQHGGVNAFRIRAILAATGSPTYGIYGGYEFVENEPRGAFEEPNDNEKYEIKVRDYSQDPYGLAQLLTKLNEIRRAHPALQRLRGFRINATSSPSIVSYTRYALPEETEDGKPDAVIVVVNLDPDNTQEATIYLDMSVLGGASVQVHDALTGDSYVWGAQPYVRLEPSARVAHVLEVVRS